MRVIHTPSNVWECDYHVRYKLHVFHPRSAGHAGTLQLDIEWVGIEKENLMEGINSPPTVVPNYQQTWNWTGSPYGTVSGAFLTRLGRHLQLQPPSNAGLVRYRMNLFNERWSEQQDRPVHPWFTPTDKITMKDPHFVAAPRKPKMIVLPEDPVAMTWNCKLLDAKYNAPRRPII